MSIRINVLGDFCPVGKLEQDQILEDPLWIGDLLPILREAVMYFLGLGDMGFHNLKKESLRK
ncbi:MAG: hypothetical protein PHR10_03705 [Sphaerochaetaceae bacterium]|nr:hypothetical protein [Sphaerochaetaceae bacterium]